MSDDKKDAMPAWPNIDDYTFAGSWTDFSGAKHEIEKYADEALYERALCAAWEARCRKAFAAIAEHNHECVRRCGVGDQEGVACGYRPYFPRHCTSCPRDEMIVDAYGVRVDELIGPLPEMPPERT